MKESWDHEIWLRVLLLAIVILLLGTSPVPKSVRMNLEAARDAQVSGDPLMVAANLVGVVKQQPWRKGYWVAAGHAALAAGESQVAGEYFAKAAALGELSPAGYLAWGDADWQAGKPETALQIWQIAERSGVSLSQTLPRQAEIYRSLGNDLALIETLKAILLLPAGDRSQMDSASLFLELGTLLAAYDPAAAPAYLIQAMDLDTNLESDIRGLSFAIQQELSKEDPAYLLLVAGRALANQGNWVLAERAFENATARNPNYAEAWAYLGEARQHTRSEENPRNPLNLALELDPQSFAANTFMALYWQRQDSYDQALAFTKKSVALDPDNPALLVQMANLFAALGDLEKGQEYYKKAMALHPNDPRYVQEFVKFSLQYNLDLREVALPMTRQFVISNPEDPAALDVMGEVLFRLGDLHSAERFFQRALDQDTTYDQAHLHLADLYRLQGEMGLARYHYQQVLKYTKNSLIVQRVNEVLDAYFVP
jgi:tetratricopeptide (TPR) repeat protein